jgi:hypothetical protein
VGHPELEDVVLAGVEHDAELVQRETGADMLEGEGLEPTRQGQVARPWRAAATVDEEDAAIREHDVVLTAGKEEEAPMAPGGPADTLAGDPLVLVGELLDDAGGAVATVA